MNTIVDWLLNYDPGKLTGEETWHWELLADYGSLWNFLLVVSFAALLYLVIRSYRREGDSPRGAKIALATIRLVVIALIYVILLQPAAVLRTTRTLFSSIVVLIDDSKSMSFSDRYADANLQKPLTGFLGINPERLTELSRRDILLKSLNRPDGLLVKLAKDHPLVFMRYSTTQPGKEQYTRQFAALDLTQGDKPGGKAPSDWDVFSKNLARRLSEPNAPNSSDPRDPNFTWEGVLKNLSAAGFETNAATGILEALERVKGQQGQRVAAIVHLGDGQMTMLNAQNRLTDALNYTVQAGTQVFSVLVGDPTPPKDVALVALEAPPEVRSGATVEFKVKLTQRNLDNQEVTVLLRRRRLNEGDSQMTTVASKTVKLEPAGGEGAARHELQEVPIPLDLSDKEIGDYRFRAEVNPRPDEQNAGNNSAEATVRVSEKKIRILLVSGDAGKEYLFLMNFLLRQPELYRVSVWQQNLDPNVNQFGSEGMKVKHLPRTRTEFIGDSANPKEFPGYDVVILYDPEATLGGFDETFVRLLNDFVDRGGGLCYVAGNKYSERTVLKTAGHELLGDLLPVILAPNTLDITERIGDRPPEAWPVGLTSYGMEHPIMRLGESDKDTEGLWSVLPGIYWSHSVMKVKPSTRVLAANSNPMRRTDRNEREPLIAVLMVGKGGRVMYVGTDETWRWRSLKDAYYYERFWSNVVRYLATLQARNVVITAGGDRFSVGERITISAEVYDEKNDYKPLAADSFTVVMVNSRDPQDVQEIVLKPSEGGRPGQYSKEIVAAHQGAFLLTALRGDPKAGEKVASKEIIIAPSEVENVRTEANLETMKNIASKPEYFRPIQEVDRLAELIPSGRLTAVNDDPKRLWDTRVSLLLIVLLLAVEWILRKKYNMA